MHYEIDSFSSRNSDFEKRTGTHCANEHHPIIHHKDPDRIAEGVKHVDI